MKTEQEYVAIKERAEKELFKIQGVHAVGLGANGEKRNETAIHVYVDKSQLPATANVADLIKNSYEGVPVQIIYAAQFEAHVDDNKYRPLQGGAQISLITSMDCCKYNYSNGTLGCLVKRNSDNEVVLLTNQHVIDGIDGSDIFQPKVNMTQCCKGYCCEKDVVASPDKLVLSSDVDGATATLHGTDWKNTIIDIGTIQGTHTVTQQEVSSNAYVLRKRGRTTGLTSGIASSISLSGTRTDGWQYVNQLAIAGVNYSNPGDSGSVVVNDANEIVGLLWGGNPSVHGVASPIAFVQAQLDITVMTGDQNGVFKQQHTVDVDNGGALYRQIAEELENHSEAGKVVLRLYNQHHVEVLHLINHVRPVTVTWHRQHGPALAKAMFECFRDHTVKTPVEMNGVSTRDALEKVASILYEYGSDSLRRDLLLYKEGIFATLGKSVNEVRSELDLYFAPAELQYAQRA
jgi:hypothetical protein